MRLAPLSEQSVVTETGLASHGRGPIARARRHRSCSQRLATASAAQLVEILALDPDELRYTLAARTLADGEVRSTCGGTPTATAPSTRSCSRRSSRSPGSVEAAYRLVQARRTLCSSRSPRCRSTSSRGGSSRRGGASASPALSVAIPSSIYTSLVLTRERFVLRRERRAARRGPCARATRRSPVSSRCSVVSRASRSRPAPQFAALVAAFLLGSLLIWAVAAEPPPLRRASSRRLWPTLAACSLGAAAFVGRLVVTPLVARGRRSAATATSGATTTSSRSRASPSTTSPAGRSYLFVVPVRGRSDRRGRTCFAQPVGGARPRRRLRRRVPARSTPLFVADRGGVREHAVRLLRAPRPVPLLRRAAVARRLRACGSPAGCPGRLSGRRSAPVSRSCCRRSSRSGSSRGNIVIEAAPDRVCGRGSGTWSRARRHLDGRRAHGLTVVAAGRRDRRACPGASGRCCPALVVAGFGLSARARLGSSSPTRRVDFARADADDRERGSTTRCPTGARVTKVSTSRRSSLPVHRADATRALPYRALQLLRRAGSRPSTDSMSRRSARRSDGRSVGDGRPSRCSTNGEPLDRRLRRDPAGHRAAGRRDSPARPGAHISCCGETGGTVPARRPRDGGLDDLRLADCV